MVRKDNRVTIMGRREETGLTLSRGRHVGHQVLNAVHTVRSGLYVGRDRRKFLLMVVSTSHQKDVKDRFGGEQRELLVIRPGDGNIGVGFPDRITDRRSWVNEPMDGSQECRRGGKKEGGKESG